MCDHCRCYNIIVFNNTLETLFSDDGMCAKSTFFPSEPWIHVMVSEYICAAALSYVLVSVRFVVQKSDLNVIMHNITT